MAARQKQNQFTPRKFQDKKYTLVSCEKQRHRHSIAQDASGKSIWFRLHSLTSNCESLYTFRFIWLCAWRRWRLATLLKLSLRFARSLTSLLFWQSRQSRFRPLLRWMQSLHSYQTSPLFWLIRLINRGRAHARSISRGSNAHHTHSITHA